MKRYSAEMRQYLDEMRRYENWRYGNGEKKKVNPYRIPATQGDIEKAKRDATNTAVASTWAIMFSVLRDKEGYDYDRLRRIWDETNYLADSIARKYVKIDDLIEELWENGIALA